jgi:hypothetical protein
MRWVGLVACMQEGRNVYRVLVRKPKGKRPLERPRYRWEDRIKVDLGEIGCGDADWIHLVHGISAGCFRGLALIKMRLVPLFFGLCIKVLFVLYGCLKQRGQMLQFSYFRKTVTPFYCAVDSGNLLSSILWFINSH